MPTGRERVPYGHTTNKDYLASRQSARVDELTQPKMGTLGWKGVHKLKKETTSR